MIFVENQRQISKSREKVCVYKKIFVTLQKI